MSRIIIPICWCPHCHNQIRVIAHDMRVDLEPIKPVIDEPKPPDKPPRVGANDWVIKDSWTKPMKVMERRSDTTLTMWNCGLIVRDADVRLFRRSTDPPEKGDRGLLDGTIEVWVSDVESEDGLIYFVFRSEDVGNDCDSGVEMVYIRPHRFTLTSPVFKPKEETDE